MGMSWTHHFPFMGWGSHGPNLPSPPGVQPSAGTSSDKVIKILETASRWIKTLPWSNFIFFFALQAGA